ncbi:hypothetical protein FS749_002537 [Ceratobasidium sp. UAMH 11750]|nr:hypothetical protein FS749_002537 [Ceratobasidium sp. UAMH 11750]
MGVMGVGVGGARLSFRHVNAPIWVNRASKARVGAFKPTSVLVTGAAGGGSGRRVRAHTGRGDHGRRAGGRARAGADMASKDGMNAKREVRRVTRPCAGRTHLGRGKARGARREAG